VGDHSFAMDLAIASSPASLSLRLRADPCGYQESSNELAFPSKFLFPPAS
jgi:hypothetical protein